MLIDIWVGDDLYLFENEAEEGERLSLERILAAGIQSLYLAADADRARCAVQMFLGQLEEDRRQRDQFQGVIMGCRDDSVIFELTEGFVHLKQVAAYIDAATSRSEKQATPCAATVLMDGLIKAS